MTPLFPGQPHRLTNVPCPLKKIRVPEAPGFLE